MRVGNFAAQLAQRIRLRFQQRQGVLKLLLGGLPFGGGLPGGPLRLLALVTGERGGLLCVLCLP